MKLKEMFYDRLPRPLKPLAKRSYQQIINYGEVPDEELHSEFVEQIFDETQEYERYVTEFERSSGASLRDEAVAEYQKMTGNESMGGVALGTARDSKRLL